MSAPRFSSYHEGVAVDVKDHESYMADVDLRHELESARVDIEPIYEGLREDFWRDAGALAHGHGYADVFAMGRSGGWLGVTLAASGRPLVLEYQPDEIPAGPLDEWEQCEADAARAFGAFAAEVLSLKRCYHVMYGEALTAAREDLEQRREAVLIRGTS